MASKKAVVHYFPKRMSPWARIYDVEFLCGDLIITTRDVYKKFTNHKPDVTCLNCLRAMAKGKEK